MIQDHKFVTIWYLQLKIGCHFYIVKNQNGRLELIYLAAIATNLSVNRKVPRIMNLMLRCCLPNFNLSERPIIILFFYFFNRSYLIAEALTVQAAILRFHLCSRRRRAP